MNSLLRFAKVSPELRAAVYYFMQFTPMAVTTAFAGIWLAEQGIAADQIGLIFAVPVFSTLLFNSIVGRLADRASDWKYAILIGNVLSGLFFFGLFAVSGFWGILIFWALANTSFGVTQPVADAATMRLCTRRGTDYANVRAWGTAGYTITLLLTGFAMAQLGGDWFVPVLVLSGILRAVAAYWLPNFRAETIDLVPPGGAVRLVQVLRPWFVLPLIGWALVFSTHLLLNAFQAYLFSLQGIGEDMIGILIALGAAAEAIVFFLFRRMVSHISARYLLLFSALVAVFRWLMMGLAPPLAVVIALQLLHGFTFALGFIGMVKFVADWTHEDIAAEAQAFAALLQGAVAATAIYAFGFLVERFETGAYFASAMVAGLGAICYLASLALRGVRSEADEKVKPETAS